MFTSKFLSKIAAVVTVFMLVLTNAQTAYAAPPSNDNFGSATAISSPLPFSGVVDNTEATTEAGEPQSCYFMDRTVWYSFTPTDSMVVRADTQGSTINSNLNVYHDSGSGISGLNLLPGGCTIFYGPITFLAEAGQTYYFQAGGINGEFGSIQINLEQVPPPGNDDFANATVIPSPLPFDDTVDTSGAGIEAGEPTPPCAYNGLMNTVWYAFTPATSGSISARVPSANFIPMLAAYTGNSLASLTEVACQSNVLTFHANAGTNYYFQVGVLYPWQQGSLMQFHLEVTPPPVANFYFYPNPPSVYDAVQFCDQSNDPGQVGFQSFTWAFGDGATSTANCASHQYAKDGDYTVQHSVTTYDGRSASTSQVVQVRTHDVAITKISAPLSANVGQTRSISVLVNNKRYSDNVQVDFYKSVPGGFQLVGSYTQFVPVRSANRTTTFTFNYTFTSSDASVGKVSFKAIATIIGANDAFPADNELISSPPTKVTR